MKTIQANLKLIIAAAFIAFTGVLFALASQAGAQNGTCVIRVGDACLADVVNELKGVMVDDVEVPSLGAQSGPDHYGVQYFHDGHSDGGVYKATTTAASATALATDILTNEGYVRYWNMNVDNAATVTLPATSSLAHFIPNTGDCWTAKWENSGDSNLTIAAGTGMDLQEPDDTSDFNVIIAANGYANVEYCRTSNSDMVVTVMETSVAD